jgi:hypothetical protein
MLGDADVDADALAIEIRPIEARIGDRLLGTVNAEHRPVCRGVSFRFWYFNSSKSQMPAASCRHAESRGFTPLRPLSSASRYSASELPFGASAIPVITIARGRSPY